MCKRLSAEDGFRPMEESQNWHQHLEDRPLEEGEEEGGIQALVVASLSSAWTNVIHPKCEPKVAVNYIYECNYCGLH